MSSRAKALWVLKRWWASARLLVRDQRGVAAVEFAFIAPLLLSLYFVTIEVSQAIETSRKVGRVGSMVADVITQQQATTVSEVDAVMKIGEALLQPYNRSKGTIMVTAIDITDEPSVVWSRRLRFDENTGNPISEQYDYKGSPAKVPDTLNIKGSFLIRVESELAYEPMITWAAESKPVLGLAAALDPITMRETYYLRPRMSQTIPCPDC
mgnify:CR=1 FL=1